MTILRLSSNEKASVLLSMKPSSMGRSSFFDVRYIRNALNFVIDKGDGSFFLLSVKGMEGSVTPINYYKILNMKIVTNWLLLIIVALGIDAYATNPAHGAPEKEREPIKKVLFIGDSMTGWMAERLEAYGIENGFEVSTVLWDGSTIEKWGTGNRVGTLVARYKPDAVFISLGMNELLERNPEKRLAGYVANIQRQLGSIPYLWVGPPSWPGKGNGDVLNNWLESRIPKGHFFRSTGLKLARQSASNPHPTKDAIQKWMDEVAAYIDATDILPFASLHKPKGVQMKRGKVFVYKRMKETL